MDTRRSPRPAEPMRRPKLGAYCACGVHLAGPDEDPAVAREAKKSHRGEVTAARKAHPLGGAQ